MTEMFIFFLLFATLKWMSVIAWSWWLVCLPLYGGIVLVVGGVFLGVSGVSLFALPRLIRKHRINRRKYNAIMAGEDVDDVPEF